MKKGKISQQAPGGPFALGALNVAAKSEGRKLLFSNPYEGKLIRQEATNKTEYGLRLQQKALET